MTSTAIVRFMVLCIVVLLSPYPCISYHTSYTHGGKHYAIRSNSNPKQPPSALRSNSEPKQLPSALRSNDEPKQPPSALRSNGDPKQPPSALRSNSDPKQPPSSSCPSIHAGSDRLPLIHRSNPCSSLQDAHQKFDAPSADDVLRRDARRILSLVGEEDSDTFTASSAAAAPSSSVATIPTKGDPITSLPGALEYHVTAGFGTPAQKLSVGFDTASNGATLLQCKPCATYSEPCDDSFDPSASTSLAHVPCGSRDCPFHSCSGPSCTISVSLNSTFLGNATFVTDTLMLSPSTTVENFRFACLEAGLETPGSSSGILDLSRNSHSLASRAPSSLFTVAFSYCLPAYKTDVGFLSIGPVRPEFSGHNVTYTPIRSSQANGNLYFVELVGIQLGGTDVPIPTTALAGHQSLLDVQTTFTYLKPDVYAVLRKIFRQCMSEYRAAAPRGELDTCYDFSGLNIIITPVMTLKFAGGASVELLIEEMMYFPDPDNVFSIACLAFAPTPANTGVVSVIGAKAQASNEVVYDVHAGRIGFVPDRC